jgi:small nuclear ribonucleoprotein (snRNP)-like protein
MLARTRRGLLAAVSVAGLCGFGQAPVATAEPTLVDGGTEVRRWLSEEARADAAPVFFFAEQQRERGLELLSKVRRVILTRGLEGLVLNVVGHSFRVERHGKISAGADGVYEVWRRTPRDAKATDSIAIKDRSFGGGVAAETAGWIKLGEIWLARGHHAAAVVAAEGGGQSEFVVIPQRTVEDYRAAALDAIRRAGVAVTHVVALDGGAGAGVETSGTRGIPLTIVRGGSYDIRLKLSSSGWAAHAPVPGPRPRFAGITGGKAEVLRPDGWRPLPDGGGSDRGTTALVFDGEADASGTGRAEWAFPGGVDLEEYPYVRLGVVVEDPETQTFAALFGIDATGDGKVDRYVPATPRRLAGSGEMAVILDLLGAARERFGGGRGKAWSSLRLIKAYFIPLRVWGVEARARKEGAKQFLIREFQVYNDRALTLPGPRVELDRVAIRSADGGEVPFQVKEGQLRVTLGPGIQPSADRLAQALKRTRAQRWRFVLRDGRRVTGTVAQADSTVVRLTGVSELDGKDLALSVTDIRRFFRVVERLAVVLKDGKRLTGIVEKRDHRLIHLSQVRELDGQEAEVDVDAVSYFVKLQEDQSGADVSLPREKRVSSPIELAVPLDRKHLREYPYLALEYEFEGPDAADVGMWLLVRDSTGERAVAYVPPEAKTTGRRARGVRRSLIDLREVLGTPMERIVGLSLLLRITPRETADPGPGPGEASTLGLRQVRFARQVPYASKTLRTAAREIPGLFDRPFLRIDGTPLIFRPPADPNRPLGRDAAWWGPLRVLLPDGVHTLEWSHPTFAVELVEVAERPSGHQSAVARVQFEKRNPTRYAVSVDAEQPFWLVFSESYHEGWKAYLWQGSRVGGQGSVPDADTFGDRREPWYERSAVLTWLAQRGRRVEIKDHFKVNAYANAWYVSKTGRHTIILEFWPQRLFEVGLAISGLTLLVCLCYLGYAVVRQRFRRDLFA